MIQFLSCLHHVGTCLPLKKHTLTGEKYVYFNRGGIIFYIQTTLLNVVIVMSRLE